MTPIPGRLVAVGVGRTAGAVGGLADSGLVVRLTRGRLWIGLLAALLVGIVALNVIALGLNASSSRLALQADGLGRANSALRARVAGMLASDRIEATAASLGLLLPEPGAISYVSAQRGDAAEAARRLRAGELGAGVAPSVAPVSTAIPVAPAPPTTAPTTPTSSTATPAVSTASTATSSSDTAAPTDTSSATPTTTGDDGSSGGTAGGGLSAP